MHRCSEHLLTVYRVFLAYPIVCRESFQSLANHVSSVPRSPIVLWVVDSTDCVSRIIPSVYCRSCIVYHLDRYHITYRSCTAYRPDCCRRLYRSCVVYCLNRGWWTVPIAYYPDCASRLSRSFDCGSRFCSTAASPRSCDPGSSSLDQHTTQTSTLL